MNTFLPYPDIIKSVQCLDNKRLGKQRVEAYQILRVLAGLTKGWRNHPAVKIWRGYEDALALYGLSCCAEWIKRGHRDTCEIKIMNMLPLHPCGFGVVPLSAKMPAWFGEPKFHASHRAALLAKDYEWYSQFGWTEKPKIEYYWPV